MQKQHLNQSFTRRTFCGALAASAVAAVCSCNEKKNSQPTSRATARGPNVLLIVSDDLNDALGCMGNSVVQSPNIDRLAARGVKFERAYCQYPVCNPSRTSLLSGLRPERTGVMSNASHPIPDRNDPPLLPAFMKQSGYFSVRVGKIYHDSRRMLEGKPLRSTDDPAGWDISEDGPVTDEDPDEAAAIRTAQQGGEPRRIKRLDAKDEETDDGFVARRVVQIMQEKLAKDRPFFLAAGFRKPHLPWVAPKKYFDLYPPEKISPPVYSPEHIRSLLQVAGNSTEGHEVSAAEAREDIAAYYACVSFLDAQVGLILDALERQGLAENTLVILIGDHGFHLGEHGLWGKNTLFERSVKTPLIVAGPGVKTGGACLRPVELLDIYPTVLDWCGLPTSGRLQGASLRMLLENPDAAWDRPAYTTLRHVRVLGKSVRSERYRYTEWDGGKEGVELYDYQSDPMELTNLAKDPAAASVVASMKRLLK